MGTLGSLSPDAAGDSARNERPTSSVTAWRQVWVAVEPRPRSQATQAQIPHLPALHCVTLGK